MGIGRENSSEAHTVNPAGLFRCTLAALLINVANEHASAQAERLANAVPRTEMAPEFDPETLPEKIDGRAIPRNKGFQLENVLHKLHARGELPAHTDLSLDKLKMVGRVLADLDDDGTGCHASLAYLEAEKDIGQSQFRAACRWFEQHGFAFNFQRVRAEDRMIGGAKRPRTCAKSTVRKIFAVPRWLAAKLSKDELLDLIAAGEKKPVASLAPLPGETPTPPAETPPAPAAKRPPEAKAPAPKVHELPRALRVLIAPLEEVQQAYGHRLPETWVAEKAKSARLEDLSYAADAMRELAKARRDAVSLAEASGKRPRRVSYEALGELAVKYLDGKRRWLDKGGEQAKLSDEAKAREAAHVASLTPEQRERRRGGTLEHNDTPPTFMDSTDWKIAGLRAQLALEQIPAKRAQLEREIAALEGTGPPE